MGVHGMRGSFTFHDILKGLARIAPAAHDCVGFFQIPWDVERSRRHTDSACGALLCAILSDSMGCERNITGALLWWDSF